MIILVVLFHGYSAQLDQRNYFIVIFFVFYWELILFKNILQQNGRNYARLVLRHMCEINFKFIYTTICEEEKLFLKP